MLQALSRHPQNWSVDEEGTFGQDFLNARKERDSAVSDGFLRGAAQQSDGTDSDLALHEPPENEEIGKKQGTTGCS